MGKSRNTMYCIPDLSTLTLLVARLEGGGGGGGGLTLTMACINWSVNWTSCVVGLHPHNVLN